MVVMGRVFQQTGAPFTQIAFQCFQRDLPDRYYSDLSPFALDAHLARPKIDVSQPQIKDFLAAQAA
jgi:hypothetical protein